jgi:hypothetical protein
MHGRDAPALPGPWLRSWASLSAAMALLCAACSGYPGGAAGGKSIPRCDTVPQIEAPAAFYRDAPIYVANEMPTDAVLAWASDKPGFEELWIDRNHHGWVTVAFSRDAATRQAELAGAFPGEGVVVVEVSWTKAELEALQRKVMTEAQPLVAGSGILTNHGVVSIFVPVLKPEVVAQIEAKFAGLRVCIDGMDPADAPAEGPQQPSGDGWRLLADQDEVGGAYRTGIATDAGSLTAMWNAIGLAATMPDVDFQAEVVIWFGAVHGSSCPRLRLDDVVVDVERSLLFSKITALDVGGCTADAIGHAYLVAVQRSKLPHGPFTIQLQSEEPPAGAMEEKTVVDADLSVPGATVGPEQLHSAPPVVDEARVESGGFVEPGYPWRYRLPVGCGVEWLGQLNGVWWRTDVPDGSQAWVPDAWRGLVDESGSIDLEITLQTDPDPSISATAGSLTVAYRASPVAGPSCP